MNQVGAIILAAGASTRLGQPKQLVKLGAENLLERAVRLARESGCAPIIVVLGSSAESIQSQSDLGDAIVVINNGWAEGMGSSVRTGVAFLSGVVGTILMTCDMPSVTSAHLRALMSSGEPTASSYAGRLGVPAYLPSSSFEALQSLKGDTGARQLLRTAHPLNLPHGEMDIDTIEDLDQARKHFEQAPALNFED